MIDIDCSKITHCGAVPCDPPMERAGSKRFGLLPFRLRFKVAGPLDRCANSASLRRM
jgi:hypothetical protein